MRTVRAGQRKGRGAPEERPERGSRPAPESARALPSKTLGEILVEEGKITPGQLAEARTMQHEDGGFLGEILVEQGLVESNEVVSLLVKHCRIPHLNLSDYELGADLAELIPQQICREHYLLPVDKLGKILTVAMVDPLDAEGLAKVREACPELRIKPILCSWDDFLSASRQLISQLPQDGDGRDLMSDLWQVPNIEPKSPRERDSSAAAAAQVSMEELTRTMRDTMQESMETMAQQVRDYIAREKLMPALPSAEELASILRESVRDTIQEALSDLTDQLRDAQTRSTGPDSQATESRESLAETMRKSVHDAVQDAMQAVSAEAVLRRNGDTVGLSSREMSALVREAMQETMATMAAQMEASKSPGSVVRFPTE